MALLRTQRLWLTQAPALMGEGEPGIPPRPDQLTAALGMTCPVGQRAIIRTMSWVIYQNAPPAGTMIVFYVISGGVSSYIYQWPVYEWTYNRDVIRYGSVINMMIVLHGGDQIAMGSNIHLAAPVSWHGSGHMLPEQSGQRAA